MVQGARLSTLGRKLNCLRCKSPTLCREHPGLAADARPQGLARASAHRAQNRRCAEIIQGLLPTLGLKIFLALVPIVLKIVSNLVTGNLSKSAIDFEVGQKYYFFQFVVVFLFTTIIGAASSGSADSAEAPPADAAAAPAQAEDESLFPIIDLAEDLADDPGSIIEFLGRSIPQQV